MYTAVCTCTHSPLIFTTLRDHIVHKLFNNTHVLAHPEQDPPSSLLVCTTLPGTAIPTCAPTAVRIYGMYIPGGWERLDGVQELAVASENVHHAVRSRCGQQSALRVPREDHRTLAMVPGVHHEQRVHPLYIPSSVCPSQNICNQSQKSWLLAVFLLCGGP